MRRGEENVPKEIRSRDKFEDLTERDKKILEGVEEYPQTVRQIARRLGIGDSMEIREALIGRLGKLEGMGLVQRRREGGDLPQTWTITFKGRDAL